MAFTRINRSDTANKGVIGLPDTPGLSASAMQAKFDELALDVIVPKHNTLISELEATSGAASLGATVPSGISAQPNVQAIINAIGSGQSALNNPSGATKVGAVNPTNSANTTVQGALNALHTRETSDISTVNSRIGSEISTVNSRITNEINTVNQRVGTEIANVNTRVTQIDTKTTNAIKGVESDFNSLKRNLTQPTGATNIGATLPSGIVASANNVQDVINEVYNACRTGGDMQKKIYDRQNRGFVDHAETADRINNIEGTEIQLKTDQRLETGNKTVVGAINELKRSADIFDSTAMFYIDDRGHYCVDTLQAQEIIEFRIDENSHLNITVNV